MRRRTQRGQTAIEYGLILSLMAMILLGIVTNVGARTHSVFCQTNTGLNRGAGCTVDSWGFGGSYLLGTGSTADTNIPTAIGSGVSNWIQVSSSQDDGSVTPDGNFTLALATDGQVVAWGDNSYGQLGDCSTVGTLVANPVAVSGLPRNIKAVAAGRDSAAALDATGHVWTWGSNADGELALPSQTNDGAAHCTPQEIAPAVLSGATAVAEGDGRLEALLSGGTLWGVGYNRYGEMGDGSGNNEQLVPAVVPGLTNVTSFAFTSTTIMALRNDGTLIGWGRNTWGQVGANVPPQPFPNDYIPTPTLVDFNNFDPTVTIKSVVTSNMGAAALDTNGQLWTWGEGDSGELANGTTTAFQDAPFNTGITNLQKLAAGSYHYLGLTANGRVMAWGSNNYGQCGYVGGDALTPVSVDFGIPKVVGIAAGMRDSYAIVD